MPNSRWVSHVHLLISKKRLVLAAMRHVEKINQFKATPLRTKRRRARFARCVFDSEEEKEYIEELGTPTHKRCGMTSKWHSFWLKEAKEQQQESHGAAWCASGYHECMALSKGLEERERDLAKAAPLEEDSLAVARLA
ncbi:unnamed protein product [Amoebophrya sp. A25]|nr:unnamed protein product [Amoebophrya sp. A25]|eukprot:GSA25T00023981001.1